MMECHYTCVMVVLEKDNAGVVEKFEEIIKDAVEGYYNTDDVKNARRMLTCDSHRRLLCQKNYKYFNDTIMAYKDV